MDEGHSQRLVDESAVRSNTVARRPRQRRLSNQIGRSHTAEDLALLLRRTGVCGLKRSFFLM